MKWSWCRQICLTHTATWQFMRTSWAKLGNCVAPSVNPGRYLVFTAMLFGFKGAPLIIGRFAAMLARFDACR